MFGPSMGFVFSSSHSYSIYHINSVMHDCIFGRYLVTLAWTHSHDDFEPVCAGFPFGLLEPMVYVSLSIISFQ